MSQLDGIHAGNPRQEKPPLRGGGETEKPLTQESRTTHWVALFLDGAGLLQIKTKLDGRILGDGSGIAKAGLGGRKGPCIHLSGTQGLDIKALPPLLRTSDQITG